MTLLLGTILASILTAHAQELKRPLSGSVQISFLPPPLEKATYSLGIFDAKTSKLVRQLQAAATEKDFTVGTNGLLTTWDGKDDSGKPSPPGRYAARGYAVGPLKIDGEEIQGNDWTADDEKLRLKAVAAIVYVPDDGGLLVLGTSSDDSGLIARFSEKGDLRWRKPVKGYDPKLRPWLSLKKDNIFFMPSLGQDGTDGAVVSAGTCRLGDGQEEAERLSHGGLSFTLDTPAPEPPGKGAKPVDTLPATEVPVSAEEAATLVRQAPGELRSPGKDRTTWVAAGAAGLVQLDHDRNVVRHLDLIPGDPLPRQVSASSNEDRLYLLETRPGWQRVRGLIWSDAREENGHPVSTWQTFFERNIHAPGAGSDADQTAGAAPDSIEINLDENPLAPGKTPKVRLIAVFDGKGSYLATNDGLRLRRVSERPNLVDAHLAKGKPPSPVEFFQYDGAATDEFSIKGIHRMMEFDAGEFELTATGEKPADPKPTEPPDL